MKQRRLSYSLVSLLIVFTACCVFLALLPTIQKYYAWSVIKKELAAVSGNPEFLQFGYEETLAAARPVFVSTIEQLVELGPDATKDEKYRLFKELTYRLYHLDETVETVERETFYESKWMIASIVGISKTEEECLEFENNLMIWRD